MIETSGLGGSVGLEERGVSMLAAGRTVFSRRGRRLPMWSAFPVRKSQDDPPVGSAQTYYTQQLQNIHDTYCSAGVCRLPPTPEGLMASRETRHELHRILAGIHVFSGKKGQRDTVVKTCPIIDGAKAMCYSHSPLSYRAARKVLFGMIHLKKEPEPAEPGKRYSVRDVYCERDYYENIGVGPGKYPSSNVINTEHTWPQSRFRVSGADKSYQKSDLHHLYPANKERNSTRGNYPFGEVGRIAERKNPSCTLSTLGYLSGGVELGFMNGQRMNALYFEPPDAHKGNVARALFYFSVRYELPIGNTQERFLRKWHKEDPVDGAERRRNQIIYEAQHNRNPFIDTPELADLIVDF